MDFPPISRFRFLTRDGSLIEGPTEWTPALVEVAIPAEERRSVALWRQGEPLDVYVRTVGGQERVLADWPRSDCGLYSLTLEMHGAVEEVEERVVTIRPQKISHEAYAQMLEDLHTRLPVEVALALQRGGGLAGVALPPPEEKSTPAQELYRLRRAVLGTKDRPGLDRVLPELARAPYQMLRSYEPWVRREQARRPSAARLALAYAAGQNLDAGRRPLKVLDTRVEHTVDVYENRLVGMFHDQVARRLRALWARLDASGPGLQDQTADLLIRLAVGRRQARFLDEVGKLDHPPSNVTMVLSRRAPYRAALEGLLELNRSVVVRLDEPLFDAPLENLPYLYQVWGTLEVIVALGEVAVEMGYTVREQHLVRRDGGEVFVRVLPDGKAALVLDRAEDGTQVRLIPERSYGRGGKLQSISYTQRPDIAIEVERKSGETEVYLFDPKYKLISEQLSTRGEEGREELEEVEGTTEEAVEGPPATGAGRSRSKPKKVDIDKMHAYRDSIVGENGERVVRYAAVLYPGGTVRYGEKIGAWQALPGAGAELRAGVAQVLRWALRED